MHPNLMHGSLNRQSIMTSQSVLRRILPVLFYTFSLFHFPYTTFTISYPLASHLISFLFAFAPSSFPPLLPSRILHDYSGVIVSPFPSLLSLLKEKQEHQVLPMTSMVNDVSSVPRSLPYPTFPSHSLLLSSHSPIAFASLLSLLKENQQLTSDVDGKGGLVSAE